MNIPRAKKGGHKHPDKQRRSLMIRLAQINRWKSSVNFPHSVENAWSNTNTITKHARMLIMSLHDKKESLQTLVFGEHKTPKWPTQINMRETVWLFLVLKKAPTAVAYLCFKSAREVDLFSCVSYLHDTRIYYFRNNKIVRSGFLCAMIGWLRLRRLQCLGFITVAERA